MFFSVEHSIGPAQLYALAILLASLNFTKDPFSPDVLKSTFVPQITTGVLNITEHSLHIPFTRKAHKTYSLLLKLFLSSGIHVCPTLLNDEKLATE